MIFKETILKDVFIIEAEKVKDERGFFARIFCEQEFKKYGINFRVAQCNVSFNKKKGTLRGMHYQAPPYTEAKLVRCTKGAIYDVVIDLRSDSPTFKRWIAVELNEKNRCMLYIPKGFAHGFQTLVDNTEVFYMMSEFYHPEYARGVRWNDPAFGIKWPIEVTAVSKKDRSYPDFEARCLQ
jgi:dTDP-4-dehydrorhamnose 3,5-epimerase